MEVPADGSCLFHSMEFWVPEKSMQKWRETLADAIQNRAIAADGIQKIDEQQGAKKKQLPSQVIVNRANDTLSTKYKDIQSLMAAMKADQWGYADFITEFVRYNQVAILCWDDNGRTSYWRIKDHATVKETFFVLNSADEITGVPYLHVCWLWSGCVLNVFW